MSIGHAEFFCFQFILIGSEIENVQTKLPVCLSSSCSLSCLCCNDYEMLVDSALQVGQPGLEKYGENP